MLFLRFTPMNSVIIKCPEMKRTFSLTQNFVKVLLSVYLIALSSLLFASSESEVITTIILIDRQAELVDVSAEGEVLKRHVAVPDYFTSGRSHTNSLKRGLDLIKDYGMIDNHVLPQSSRVCNHSLQSYLLSESRSRAICKMSESQSSNGWSQDYDIAKRDWDVDFKYHFGEVKLNEERKKGYSKSLQANQKASFADVFFPSISIVHTERRQHNIDKVRFHRGIFIDT